MAGSLHMTADEAETSKALINGCMALLEGHDAAVVLGVLTSLVTLALDDTGVPLRVFVEALRGSEKKLASLRGGR